MSFEELQSTKDNLFGEAAQKREEKKKKEEGRTVTGSQGEAGSNCNQVLGSHLAQVARLSAPGSIALDSALALPQRHKSAAVKRRAATPRTAAAAAMSVQHAHDRAWLDLRLQTHSIAHLEQIDHEQRSRQSDGRVRLIDRGFVGSATASTQHG